jgi:hypothetical protein
VDGLLAMKSLPSRYRTAIKVALIVTGLATIVGISVAAGEWPPWRV